MLFVLKAIGGPGSIGFLAICSALGALVSRTVPRARRFARAWLLFVYSTYIVLGLPVVANLIGDSVSSYTPLASFSELRDTDTLVVLDGDNRIGRLREARRVFDAISPKRVVVSGPPWLTDFMLEAGFPAERLITDPEVTTTLDQIHNLPRLLRDGQAHRVVIVASRLQMPRVAALAQAVDLPATLAPSPIDEEPPTAGLGLFIPQYRALRVSRDA